MSPPWQTAPMPITRGRRRFPAGVWAAAGGAVALLVAVSSRYGFHRDELYFLVAGRRLDWGFVDQPPLTPLVARFSELLGGTTPTSLRILPALVVGAVALMAASMARQFGGRAVAQVYAAFAAGWAGVILGEGHLLSTAIFDFGLWTCALWVLIRILDGADERWWLVFGLTIGIGMQNKYTIGFFAGATVIVLLASRSRTMVRGVMPWLGAGIALIIAFPNLAWQANHGWPQVEMGNALRARGDGPIAFVLLQAALLSLALAVPAAFGWWHLLRSETFRQWRPIALIYVFLFFVFLLSGGKAYYLAPMYSALLAAGAVWFEGLGVRPRRWMAGASFVGVAVGLFISLPLLPASSSGTLDATGELGETVGWPELVDQIATVHQEIPADLRSDVVIFTGSYGQAGAVDILGEELGLPRAISGHNTYWLWGPGESRGPIIGVGHIDDVLTMICPQVEQAGVITNPHGVENEEAGQPLWRCLHPARPLADVWDLVRHYN